MLSETGQVATNLFPFPRHTSQLHFPSPLHLWRTTCLLSLRVQRLTDVSFPSQGSCEQLHCVRLPFPSLATLETVIHRAVFPEWKRLGFPSQCNWSAAKGGTEPEPLHISLRRKKKCDLPFSRGYLVLIIIAATINCLNGSKHQVSIPPL